MKVAIYARVSTDEQTLENQTLILTKWAEDRGWEVGEAFCDTGSAFQHTDQRELKRLLGLCDKGTYKLVLVFSLSRLTRKGPLELMQILKQFSEKGAPVYSYTEPEINVSTDWQPILVTIYGIMNRLYSTNLSANTKAGMARAKAAGKHVGRPRKKGLEIPQPLL